MADVVASVRVTTAIMAGRSEAMDVAARMVLASVKRVAAQHILTGHYMNQFSIHTVPGVTGTGRQVSDRLIVNNDDGAAAIEVGRIYRVGNGRRVRFEPGKHIMRRGMEAASG